ncbi:MAG: hypothetical protein RIB65_18355 [Ilumatobacter fluminis]|uniref:hypothetical protein n=1 Tax=Ilumatobacter fluminis TaxID=467091 RepID=UPI0032EE3600
MTSRPLALVALLLLAPLAACTPDDETDASTGCAERVRVASRAIEPDDQVRLLDDALLACNSYEGFRAQVGQYPGIIGYDLDTFLELRCVNATDERVGATAACRAVVAPPTTPPEDTEVELVFVGDTIDGRRVEIRPSSDVPFEGDIPEVVQQTVDIAVESGCLGVLRQRNIWLDRVDDSDLGDIASVFAQHAQNVAVYIGCEPDPIAPEPDA